MKLKFIRNEKNNTYSVHNGKREKLGVIEWYADWDCYVWEQELGIVMSMDCLKQVVEFAEKLTELVS